MSDKDLVSKVAKVLKPIRSHYKGFWWGAKPILGKLFPGYSNLTAEINKETNGKVNGIVVVVNTIDGNVKIAEYRLVPTLGTSLAKEIQNTLSKAGIKFSRIIPVIVIGASNKNLLRGDHSWRCATCNTETEIDFSNLSYIEGALSTILQKIEEHFENSPDCAFGLLPLFFEIKEGVKFRNWDLEQEIHRRLRE